MSAWKEWNMGLMSDEEFENIGRYENNRERVDEMERYCELDSDEDCEEDEE